MSSFPLPMKPKTPDPAWYDDLHEPIHKDYENEDNPLVLAELEKLLRKNPNVFHLTRDCPDNPTVLHYLATHGCGGGLEWLLNLPKDQMPFEADHGAGPFGSTPLHNGCLQASSLKVVQVLLAHGADPMVVDGSGNPAAAKIYSGSYREEGRILIMPVLWASIKSHPLPSDEVLKKVFTNISPEALSAAQATGSPLTYEAARHLLHGANNALDSASAADSKN